MINKLFVIFTKVMLKADLIANKDKMVYSYLVVTLRKEVQ